MDLISGLEKILPKERIKTRLIDLVSYASDAGFYYLRPKAIVLPDSEEEIKCLFYFSQTSSLQVAAEPPGCPVSRLHVLPGSSFGPASRGHKHATLCHILRHRPVPPAAVLMCIVSPARTGAVLCADPNASLSQHNTSHPRI